MARPCGCPDDYHLADCGIVTVSDDPPDEDDWRLDDEDWTSQIFGCG